MSGAPVLRIATRNSPLAMWQAHHVADLLRAHDPSVVVEYIDTATFADKRLDLPISKLGGKGAFSKEIQTLVLDGAADLAVHSAKDLQAVTPEGLTIAAYPERGEVRDALVGSRLDDLAEGAVVATGSNRRRVQLANLRPDLIFEGLRGNIATRLGKADNFDAIVMAAAAFDRLEISPPVVDVLEPEVMVPQVGQGALAVECRAEDAALIERLAAFDHGSTRTVVSAERGFLVELGGDCDLPAGAHARLNHGQLSLTAILSSPDESQVGRVTIVDTTNSSGPAEIGAEAARQLQAQLGLT